MNAFPGQSDGAVAGVIGFPVMHSRSPLIHNYWLKKYGLQGCYAALPVSPADLESFFRALKNTGWRGCNVTVPHKEETLRYMTALDPLAAAAGAVNTVVVRKDGTLEGQNTDIHGFTANLESAGKAWKRKKPALVVGAGGAARAVIVALHEAGCKHIRITNRTSDRARDLVNDMKARSSAPLEIVAWEDREDVLEDIGLLVNTTTQGMEGQPPLALSLRTLNEAAVVTDLVYTPLVTPLLAEARRHGCVIVDGLGMLLHQAAPAFAAWFGVTPDVTAELRALVEKGLREKTT